MAVCPWTRPGCDSTEEVTTFQDQRLSSLERHRSRLCCHRYRGTLAPVDPMHIDLQLLAPAALVIEHGHAGLAYHNELLLLERVQPRNVDVRVDAACEP